MPRRTPGDHFCPIPSPNSTTTHARATLPPVSVAQGCHAARPGDTYARFRRPTVHYHTLGRHFCPISVAQRCRAARSGNTSDPFRRPMVPRRTPGRHRRPFPSPSGAAAHARGTLLSRSVAQRCRGARSGNTSAPFRRPTVPRSTLREHFCHYPSPNGALPHARGTLKPVYVAQRCRGARSGDTYARFRRRGGRGKGNGQGGRSMGDGREAGQGLSLGGGWTGGWTGGRKRQRDRHGHGDGDGDGREAGPGRSLGRGQGKGRGRAYIKEPRTS